jgi:hypothetical protein
MGVSRPDQEQSPRPDPTSVLFPFGCVARTVNCAELYDGGYCYKSIWDNLADQYNNTGVSSGEQQDGDNNSYFNVI